MANNVNYTPARVAHALSHGECCLQMFGGGYPRLPGTCDQTVPDERQGGGNTKAGNLPKPLEVRGDIEYAYERLGRNHRIMADCIMRFGPVSGTPCDADFVAGVGALTSVTAPSFWRMFTQQHPWPKTPDAAFLRKNAILRVWDVPAELLAARAHRAVAKMATILGWSQKAETPESSPAPEPDATDAESTDTSPSPTSH